MTLPSPTNALDPMLPVAVRVASVSRETHDTCTVVIEPAEGGVLPGFAPGQFSMLYQYGVGEVPISISGDPGVEDRPVDAAKGGDVLVVAGGIGLAPLRPVIYHVLRHRSDYGRLIILYGARSPKELLFIKELKFWSAQPETQVLVTVDTGGTSWRGNVGVVTKLFEFIKLRPDRTIAMSCGPEIMMRFVMRQLGVRAIPDEKIFLSMELNMKCAVGFCGHCQMGPYFLCKDGTVFSYAQLRRWMGGHREL